MHALTLSTGMVALLGLSLTHGCHTPAKTKPRMAAVRTADPTVSHQRPAAQQVAHGAKVYAQQCAHCHGDSGEGSDEAPALVGSGALPRRPREDSARQAEFRTALDVAMFVTQNMPPDEQRRSEIAEQDYWAILAFALSANGVQLTEPVAPQNAQAIVLHP